MWWLLCYNWFNVCFLDSLIGGIADFFGGERANEANSAQAEANRQFQERMSSSAYQRGTADMMAAGLNPMLAYQQGGASSPGGSMPAPMQNTIGSAVHTAMAYRRQSAEVENIKAQTEKTRAETPGAEATSKRLAYELENLVPTQLQSARLDMQIKETEAYVADLKRQFLDGEAPGVRNKQTPADRVARIEQVRTLVFKHFDAEYREMPVEVRRKMADTALKHVEAKYHPYKLVAPAIGAAAGAASALGVGKLLHGYKAMKGAVKSLGSGTGSPAVFRHRRPARAARGGESGYQYTRPQPGPSKY